MSVKISLCFIFLRRIVVMMEVHVAAGWCWCWCVARAPVIGLGGGAGVYCSSLSGISVYLRHTAYVVHDTRSIQQLSSSFRIGIWGSVSFGSGSSMVKQAKLRLRILYMRHRCWVGMSVLILLNSLSLFMLLYEYR